MNTRARHRILAIAAVASASALALAGCSGDNGGSGDANGDEEVTLTVTTFGTFGYEDLYKEYEKAHPNVKIEATNIDTGGNARTDAFTKIAAGSGLSDVVAIEEGWLGAIMDVSDTFVDLRDYGIEDRKDDWVDWKYGQATDAEGRVIGYGTDIGPSGICYNGAAFEAAGLPSDRESVAELLNGDWANYFKVGADYTAKTGKAWYDHSGFVWNAMVNQLDEGYYTSDGKLNVEDNAELKERFEQLGAATEGGQSAAQTAWDWNGGKSFVDGTFATFVCPGWMLGVVQGQVEAGGGDASTGWDFADVFPGGAANWGGAFLSIPESSQHKEAAAELADWLTQPEQQVKQSAAAGNFPSTIEAQETLAADATPNAFFNDAPTGAILAERAKGVVAQFKGADDSVIQENVFGPALSSLDRGDTDTQGAWDQAIGLLNDLVG
ncbi:extracellular solute-binding protein [Microbacterium oxydans]|uniref:ABC transporter substrate-binding protein n=1 Tax=Microbacterium TaxID=33882 RepID=UPI000DE2099B|nr:MULTISPECIES: extracellular solute-binding protein [unclassified Microbacterium]MBE7955868.1 extracellular solute-binding protein [Microbacterium sp. R1]NYF29523.1 cellobiose transport system substrate-binding protein [Microbacterium sp. JAI119]RBO71771.1 carbohydrate ABC transporter substrate-binding protein [Microbacterium sp. H6]